MEQKFVPATKTAHQYQGQINGKTYVVPHSTLDIYKKDGYAKPMRHAIVTSQAHVKNNNPDLNPEEVARVHEHIKNLHGGLEPAKLEEEYDYPDPGPYHPHRAGDMVHYRHGTTGHMKRGEVVKTTDSHVIVQPTGSNYSYKIPHTDVIKNYRLQEEDSMLQEDVFTVTDHKGASHEVSAKDAMDAKKKLVSGHVNGEQIPMTQWHKVRVEKKQLEEASHRGHAAGAEGHKYYLHHAPTGHITSHIFRGRRQDMRTAIKKMNDPTHPSHDPDFEYTEHGIPKNLRERVLTSAESEKKEELVHKLKPKLQSFKSRYGADKGKSVMYAVATKQAKKLAESPGQLDEAVNFMTTYRKNEAQNRHTANIAHLARHFGTKADQDEARFYVDALEKHGHQPHHEAAYRLHQKLYPKALAAHEHEKASGKMSESVEQLDELKRSTLAKYVGKASSSLATSAYSSAMARQHERNVEHPISKAHFGKQADRLEKKTAKRERGITRAASKLAEETVQLDELKMPKFGFAGKLFTTTPRTVAHGVHSMGHEELKGLHKHYQQSPPKSEIQKQQHRSIQKELKRRGNASVSKSQFVKRDLKEAVHAYDVFHNGRNIDTVFYGHHEDPEEVKKSLVNHDNYHPNITVKKVKKTMKEEHSTTHTIVKSVLNEMVTRKHFQQVADVIKAHPDADKRKELAHHHAEIFKKSNPRFDQKRFFDAAGVSGE